MKSSNADLTAGESMQKRKRGGQPKNQNAAQSGFWSAIKAKPSLIAGTMDRRTTPARLVAEIEREYHEDRGGLDQCSQAERVLIRTLAVDTLILAALDGYLLRLGDKIIRKRAKTVVPLLEQRNKLAGGLAQRLGQLGLARVPAPVPSLAEFLQQHASERPPEPEPTDSLPTEPESRSEPPESKITAHEIEPDVAETPPPESEAARNHRISTHWAGGFMPDEIPQEPAQKPPDPTCQSPTKQERHRMKLDLETLRRCRRCGCRIYAGDTCFGCETERLP